MTSVFIISAPSGSGKSTLVSYLMRGVAGLRFSVSYTTRAPRGEERDGREYYFISREQFEARVERGEFLEWAEVFGNLYGTHRSELDRAAMEGMDLVLDIDVQGARQLKERIPGAVSIFILPPSRQVLEQRLRARSQDSGPVFGRLMILEHSMECSLHLEVPSPPKTRQEIRRGFRNCPESPPAARQKRLDRNSGEDCPGE